MFGASFFTPGYGKEVSFSGPVLPVVLGHARECAPCSLAVVAFSLALILRYTSAHWND